MSLPWLPLVLLLIHLPNLANAGGILRLLVRRSKGDDPRESQREPRLIADLTSRVPRARRDLVSQHLHHHLWLEPDVRNEKGVHSSWLLAHLQPVHLPVKLSPSLVGEAG